jgi:diacylglycerol kinase (ATP)
VRIDLITNPRAGRGRPGLLRALLRAGGHLGEAEFHVTTRPGEAFLFAKEVLNRGSDLVLAAGGDGTVNEVASALVGTKTCLGVIPTGSGNGLGRGLGVPLDVPAALEALRTAEPRPMDVGFVNGRPFFNVAGAGFDAAIGSAFQARGSNGRDRGLLGYFEIGFKEVWNSDSRSILLETDRESIAVRALVVAFANGRQYGAGAVIAPQAFLDDGFLNVVVFEESTTIETLAHVPKLFMDGVESFPAYRHVATRRAVLRTDRPWGHHRDGEPDGEDPVLEVTLGPSALNVLVPARTLRDPSGPFLPRRGGDRNAARAVVR